jgi:hypothetical protein
MENPAGAQVRVSSVECTILTIVPSIFNPVEGNHGNHLEYGDRPDDIPSKPGQLAAKAS